MPIPSGAVMMKRPCIVGAEKIDRRLDLCGKVCPGPTFDTRMTLNEMAAGDRLEVMTDCYPLSEAPARLPVG